MPSIAKKKKKKKKTNQPMAKINLRQTLLNTLRHGNQFYGVVLFNNFTFRVFFS